MMNEGTSTEHWWRDTDQQKKKELLGEKLEQTV